MNKLNIYIYIYIYTLSNKLIGSNMISNKLSNLHHIHKLSKLIYI
jgi:hypothetical protein